MDTLTTIEMTKKNYYLSDDIIGLNLSMFEGYKNGRRMVDNLEIPSGEYIYAKLVDDKWMISNGKSYKFDKVLIRTKWIDEYVNNQNEESSESDEEPGEESDEESDEESPIAKLMPLPGLIQLKKSEKMRDNDGNILEIEVRGTREHNNCFLELEVLQKVLG